ncbi:gliding motility-associated C-terminal domain-containing protein [Flavivirga aquimarina]|uniref:Gliding motility-associated C-terminal domain-containing protein n=1 Tax=Flavivirga aquimarina TaxID=2027862 RepID=A0ABT8WH56_9FLAO|nr:gliding motility-associated C-terminal domain-containing protein [Flavivirga aquimarina]MDO5972451.1 gliding motility-associated C-terminal domain-containing protein [Flavivirga aquimarina]
MKTTLLFRNVLKNTFYMLLLLCTSLSVFAQCPTIPDPTPPAICDDPGLTFADLISLPYNYVNDGGNGIQWYNVSTGGVALNSTSLVTEGTYYVDDDSGTCGSRASITINFTVDPTGQVLHGIYCSNENPILQDYIDQVLTPNIPSGGSVEVYYSSNLSTQADPNDTLPHLDTNLVIVFVDGVCRSQYEPGLAFVINSPQDPTPADPQEFCVSDNPTIGDLDTGTLATNFNWYGGLDGFGNPIMPLASTEPLMDGAIYYIQIDDPFSHCDSNPVPVTVNIDIPLDAGTSNTLTYCEDSISAEPPFNLFDSLLDTPDTGGSWSSSPTVTTTNGDSGTVDISTLTADTYVFTYTLNNAPSECDPSISTITIVVSPILSSGTSLTIANPETFCVSELSSNFNLMTLLDTDADPGGQWTEGASSAGTVIPSLIDLTTGAYTPAGSPYSFTYTQNVTTPCPDNSTTIQIAIVAEPNTGTADPATYCENDPALNNATFDLFTLLTGTVDGGGQWYLGTDTTGTMIPDILDLNTLTNLQVYNYTYSVTDINGCTNSTTTSITIDDAPNAGTATNPNPFCVVDITPGQTLDLSDYLSADADPGVWNDDTLSNQLTGSILTLDGLLSGTTYSFTFDVTAIGSCDAPEMPVVLITINPQPDTGTADSAIYCENDPALNNATFDLFTLLTGTVNAGGQWYLGTDTTGTMIPDILDLNTLTNLQVYNYTYSVTDINGCTSSTTTSITIEDAPNAGTTTNPNPFCVADIAPGQTLDLSDYLSADADSGIWIDDTPSNELSGSIVNLDRLLPGMTYSFTFDVTAIGGCDTPEMPMVTIIINDTPVPTANATQEFCDAATVGDLIATGTTIQWYDDATGGTPLDGTLALINGENYFATDTDAATGCESSTRTEVTVTIHQSPNAGIAANPGILECNNTTINLFDGLDGTQDGGGTWYEGPDNTGTVVATPTTYDITGFSANNYQFTYYVTASLPCVDDSTTITVTIEGPLSAGTSNGDPTFCSTDGIFDLDSNLTGASPGGEWTFNSAVITDQFDPATGQSGTYTYTTSNACGNSSTSFDISVTPAPNAGTSGSALICVIDGPTDLFTFLGTADTGGTWSPSLASGTGVFDPLVDTNGVYTYTVTANAPCLTDAIADITVTVSDITPPVVNNATMEFCLVDNPTVANLDAALTVTGTITWYEDVALTTQLNATNTLVDGEDYYATQRNAAGCESSISVQVDVIVNDTPTPTILDSGIEYCINDGPTINDLSLNITEYNAATDNIIWYDAETGGTAISSSSLLDHDTTYYAVLVDATTGCESSVRLVLTTDLTSCGKLILPDGFSPNGDGTNDTYDFDNLHVLYPDFIIEIFNRYGNIVYKGNANTSRFDGTSNQSGTIGSGDLPVGVYYYIFYFNDNENKPEQGRLYLSR